MAQLASVLVQAVRGRASVAEYGIEGHEEAHSFALAAMATGVGAI